MIWIWLCICVLFEDLFIFSRRLQGSASRHFIIDIIGELTSTHQLASWGHMLSAAAASKFIAGQVEQQLPRVLGVPHFDPFSTLPWGYPITKLSHGQEQQSDSLCSPWGWRCTAATSHLWVWPPAASPEKPSHPSPSDVSPTFESFVHQIPSWAVPDAWSLVFCTQTTKASRLNAGGKTCSVDMAMVKRLTPSHSWQLDVHPPKIWYPLLNVYITNWKDPPFCSWVNPLFLWPFSSSQTVSLPGIYSEPPTYLEMPAMTFLRNAAVYEGIRRHLSTTFEFSRSAMTMTRWMVLECYEFWIYIYILYMDNDHI